VAKIKVGIFDDHAFSAKGLAYFLSCNEVNVMIICTSKSELIEKVAAADLDVLILDISAPDVAGLELFEYFYTNHTKLKIVALSSLSSVMLVENLLILGVKGFVNKKQKEEDILECLKITNNGAIYIPKEYHFLTSKYRVPAPVVLSEREIEIIKLIAQELTSQEIADRLFISYFTVENHRKNIFRKMGVKNLAGMIMAATRMGYIG